MHLFHFESRACADTAAATRNSEDNRHHDDDDINFHVNHIRLLLFWPLKTYVKHFSSSRPFALLLFSLSPGVALLLLSICAHYTDYMVVVSALYHNDRIAMAQHPSVSATTTTTFDPSPMLCEPFRCTFSIHSCLTQNEKKKHEIADSSSLQSDRCASVCVCVCGANPCPYAIACATLTKVYLWRKKKKSGRCGTLSLWGRIAALAHAKDSKQPPFTLSRVHVDMASRNAISKWESQLTSNDSCSVLLSVYVKHLYFDEKMKENIITNAKHSKWLPIFPCFALFPEFFDCKNTIFGKCVLCTSLAYTKFGSHIAFFPFCFTLPGRGANVGDSSSSSSSMSSGFAGNVFSCINHLYICPNEITVDAIWHPRVSSGRESTHSEQNMRAHVIRCVFALGRWRV